MLMVLFFSNLAPYSNFKVGCAILGGDDKIYTGCNVENISYGLCICAERNTVFHMVSKGVKTLKVLYFF
jgi:cytidine deaminase